MRRDSLSFAHIMRSHVKQRGMVSAARAAAYAAAVIAALIVIAALAVPAFLDTPAVERELQAKLSRMAHGEIAWEDLSIRLLPSPRGKLARARVEIPGALSLRAERIDARLRLLPLLRGRAEIASVSVSKPVIRVDIAASSDDEKGKARRGPVAVEAIRGFGPHSVIEIDDGEVEVRVPELPPI